MHLYLSTNSPWNATYSNIEGQVIYKAESPRLPFGIGPLPITIERAIPSNVAKTEMAKTAAGKAEEADNAAVLRGPFCPLAEIDFRASSFIASRIRYNSIDMAANEFFRKTGIFRK